MSVDKKYKEYEEKLYSITDRTMLTADKVNEFFSELLTVLPNNGKLYKYKVLETFHIDELVVGYIWFSSAKMLNDNKDCAFNANYLQQIEEMVKFFLTDGNYRKTLVKGLYMELATRDIDITPQIIEDCLSCVSKNGSKFSQLKFNKFCREYRLTKEQRQKLINTIALYSDERQNEETIRKSVSNLCEQMEKIRSGNQICSLTSSYDKDSMWAYYCGNRGICIEYDFNKINSVELKNVFINTQKVRYGRKKKFRYVDIIKLTLQDTLESKIEADKLIFNQLLTKDKSWSTEEEWRVLIHSRDNEIGLKIPAKIISAIYIDYSVLQEDKAKRIIKLANRNGWKIFVRYFSRLEAEYRYDTIENINAYNEKIAQIQR